MANWLPTIPTLELVSVDALLEFLEVSGSESFEWFRGHSSSEYELLPQLLRKGKFRPDHELLGSFVQRAGAIPDAPQLEDYTAWISVAQHHGLPTRALDWSESFLVAVFFAVIDAAKCPDPSTEGTVWMLDPKGLNAVHWPKSDGVYREADHCILEAHIRAMLGRPSGAPFEVWPVMAYRAQYRNARMAAQKAAFTWHLDTVPLEQHSSAPRYLRRILIPSTAKTSILRHLSALGISESTLFPDFEGIARELCRRVPAIR